MDYIKEEERKDWYKKTGLKPRKVNCSKCGREVNIDVPFENSDYIGLSQSEKDLCCGGQYQIHVFQPKSQEKKDLFNKAFEAIKDIDPSLICPYCGCLGNKVIAAGLPMKHCMECSTLWGFWSDLYTHLIAPLEAMINGGFCFMVYTGSYIGGLIQWLKGNKEE